MAHARAIDIIDITEIEEEFSYVRQAKVTNQCSRCGAIIAKNNAAAVELWWLSDRDAQQCDRRSVDGQLQRSRKNVLGAGIAPS